LIAFLRNQSNVRIAYIIYVLLLFACSGQPAGPVGSSDAINATTDTISKTLGSMEILPEGLLFKDNETFFRALVEKKFVTGELIDIVFITENLVSVDEGEPVKLSVALIKSGEGMYSGARAEIQYATIHCLLVVFKWVGDEQVFRDFLSLGDVESQGLISGDIEAEEIKIAGDKTAVLIHFKSSEEGAGDYGFRKDDAALYAFVKGKLSSVLEMTLDDFQFSSDEQGSYSERTSTTEFKVLETQSNGFYDVWLLTTTSISVTGEEQAADINTSPEREDDIAPVIYKWDGNRYIVK
jgi:hypothetical protein